MAEDDDQLVTVAAVLDHLDAAAGTVSLDELGAAFGFSGDHLARLFRTHVGVSPARYQHHLRAETARRLLADRSVLDTTIELGESSPGRVHDLLVTVEAVTPGEARRHGDGVTIEYGVHPSVFGPLLVATTDRGVVQLAFLREEGRDAALDGLRARWRHAQLRRDDAGTDEVATRVRGAMAGATDDDRPLPLLLCGTNLQLAVWRALLRLPAGTTLPYGELAAAIGRPTAVRAVASAVGRNPVAPLVPCHRVLRATGALGGYRWGLPTKRRLLAVEAALHETDPQATLPV